MPDTTKILRYEKELAPLRDVIYQDYHESEDMVFRNILSVPSTIKDITPQSKRVAPEVDELIVELTEEDIKDMSLKEKREYIADRTLSVYNSLENCLAETAFWVRRIRDRYSIEDAEIYLKEKRGAYIAEIQLNKEIGLIETHYNKKGHANVLLYEGGDLGTNIVRIHGPFTLAELLKDSDADGN